jgi:hypothetical protein
MQTRYIYIFLNLFLLLSSSSMAVTTTVNKTSFHPGDVIHFNITSTKNNVLFPDILQIGKYPVLSTTASIVDQTINGQKNQQITKTYIFSPVDNLTIPAYKVIVDGKIEKTKEIFLQRTSPTRNKAETDFVLTMETNKDEFFMGEEIDLTITLKQKKSLSKGQRINILPLFAKDLNFKTDRKFVNSSDHIYNNYVLHYRVNAQTFGKLTIPSAVAVVSTEMQNIFNNFFSMEFKQAERKIYSNPLTIKVRPLPEALTIFGDFDFTASVDKREIKAGEALNLTLTIQGAGNIEDITAFKFNLPKATIYKDEPTINKNQWQQKFAIIAEDDFTIPSFKFAFFDKKTQRKKQLSSETINVKIKQAQTKSTLNTKIKTTTSKKQLKDSTKPSKYSQYYLLLLGLIIGIIISIVFYLFKNKKQSKNQDLIKQIKSCKSDKTLFELLMPLNLEILNETLNLLEGNLYQGKQHKINKKNIINAIKSSNKTYSI